MGKFGEFGELSAIHQTKLVLTINNLLADLLIRQTFFCQMLETSQFAKLFPRQTFPLYGIFIFQAGTCNLQLALDHLASCGICT